ncbi:MAG TPA: hypothetical protein VF039_11860 [Longimicrobiales bacterium]
MTGVIRVIRAGVVTALVLAPSAVAAQEIRPFEPAPAAQLPPATIAIDPAEVESSNVGIFTATGAMIGAGLAMIDANNCTGEWCFGPVLSEPVGALLGAGIGWMVGAIVDEWRRRDAATN